MNVSKKAKPLKKKGLTYALSDGKHINSSKTFPACVMSTTENNASLQSFGGEMKFDDLQISGFEPTQMNRTEL